MTLRQIAYALGGEVSSGQVLCPGPGHSPKDRSLCVKLSGTAPDGFVVNSFAGDDPIACRDYVRSRLGLPTFKPNGEASRNIVYEFRDPATGAVRYHKKRIERADGTKTFVIEPTGRNGSEPLLYGGERLADLREGQPVFIVEGEKKVERLRELRATAVSLDSGAKSKWLPSHAALLRGLRIILWPDSDEAGEKYVANASAAILACDPFADIRVVRPFGPPNGSKGKDVCNWEGNAEDLNRLAASAEAYAAPREAEDLPRPNGESPKFPIVAWKDIAFDPNEEWRVDRVFPRVGLAALYGGPGTVKTFVLLDVFLRIATGGFFGGREVEQGPVVYIAAEGGGGIKKRIEGLKKFLAEQNLPPDVPFYLITVAPDFGTGEADRIELIRCIEALGIQPAAIGIDTAAQSLGGADENGQGMAQLVINATALFNYFKCLVALIHHVPLSDDKRLRGKTDLIGALDVSILVEREKGSMTATLTVMKLKDEDDLQKFTVHLERVVVCQDKRGRDVSTLVVESVTPGSPDENGVSAKRLPSSAENALSALRYALDEVGAIPPASNHIPAGQKAVRVDQWRTYADMRSALDKPDSKLKAFVRGSECLQARKIVGIWGDYAWLIK
jgi:AAA domain